MKSRVIEYIVQIIIGVVVVWISMAVTVDDFAELLNDFENAALFMLIAASIGLNVHFAYNVLKQRQKGSLCEKCSVYEVEKPKFSELTAKITDVLNNYNLEESDTPPITLLHWVPTFSLSRGCSGPGDDMLIEGSELYQKIKSIFNEHGGSIVCFDGCGIYRFLYKSRVLYRKPSNYVRYINEVNNILRIDKLDIRLRPWGGFPHNLLIIGKKFAVFDFTSIKYLQKSAGFRRANNRITLTMTTTIEREVKWITNNIYNPFREREDVFNNQKEIDKTIRYLEMVAETIEQEDKVEPPLYYESKFWN